VLFHLVRFIILSIGIGLIIVINIEVNLKIKNVLLSGDSALHDVLVC
jgi:hypothetical protein